MRKITVIVMIVMMFFGSVSLVAASKNVETDNSFLRGTTVLEVDSKGQKLKDVKARRTSKLFISESSIEDTVIELEGKLQLQLTEKPFHITGELFKSSKSDERVVGELKDELGNFQVIHFSIDSNPKNTFMFNKNLKNSKGNLLKLYLLDKDNRNFTFIEVDNSKLLEGTTYSDPIAKDDLEVVSFDEEHWYVKFLKPVKKEIIEDSGVNDINIMGNTQTINKYRIYSLSYEVVGGTATENIRVGHYLAYDDRPSGDFDWDTKLYIDKKWTTSDVDDWNGNDSNMKVGYYLPSKIKAVTDKYELIKSHTWSYQTKNDSDIGFKVSWNKNKISAGPLTFSANYTDQKSSFSGFSYVHTNDLPDNAVRDVEQQFKDGYLDSTAHKLMTIFKVGKSNSYGSKQIKVQYIYDVSNIYDYAWGGEETYTIDQYYYYRE